ncbi:hypothetical protein [Mesorhizobium sp. M7A.F.Ca.CA.002.12.1.1]|uniref:hypothetical protein n=1 Tax=Mesorhizobium sp. M7A.F.Ca.CA.002.12.1.1 TaxID=2496735 RepID=UPI000FC9B614|nr:hypothetical protein [Mesorhizobium sp. M7A.F.Ca.CA.002.12.1.1]RUX60172.1 hypothetical protein EN989_11185 [Mesorhizobium sp. M7A.F.Ca.CA.002.12.1.1]
MIPEPWKPADRYMVFTLSMRMARSILDVDHQIDARLPLIKFTNRIESFHGKRGARVLTLDPHFELRERDRFMLNEMATNGRIVGWSQKDFEYLQKLTSGELVYERGVDAGNNTLERRK